MLQGQGGARGREGGNFPPLQIIDSKKFTPNALNQKWFPPERTHERTGNFQVSSQFQKCFGREMCWALALHFVWRILIINLWNQFLSGSHKHISTPLLSWLLIFVQMSSKWDGECAAAFVVPNPQGIGIHPTWFYFVKTAIGMNFSPSMMEKNRVNASFRLLRVFF